VPERRRRRLLFGQDPAQAAAVTTAVVRATTLPVIVKLTPNVTDTSPSLGPSSKPGRCAVRRQHHPSDGESTSARAAVLSAVSAAVRPPIKPVALRAVYQVAGPSTCRSSAAAASAARDAIESHGGRDGRAGGDGDLREPECAARRARRHRCFMTDAGVSDVRS